MSCGNYQILLPLACEVARKVAIMPDEKHVCNQICGLDFMFDWLRLYNVHYFLEHNF